MKFFLTDIKTRAGLFISPYPSDMRQYVHNPKTRIWIDFFDPNRHWARRNLRIPAALVSLAKDTSITAHFEQQSRYFLIKIPFCNPSKDSASHRSGHISFICKPDMIISLHDTPVDCFADIESDADAMGALFARGADCLLAHLIARLCAEYSVLIEKTRQARRTPSSDTYATVCHFKHLLRMQRHTLRSMLRHLSEKLHIGSKRLLRRSLSVILCIENELGCQTEKLHTALMTDAVHKSAQSIRRILLGVTGLIAALTVLLCTETIIRFIRNPLYGIGMALLCLLVVGGTALGAWLFFKNRHRIVKCAKPSNNSSSGNTLDKDR